MIFICLPDGESMNSHCVLEQVYGDGSTAFCNWREPVIAPLPTNWLRIPAWPAANGITPTTAVYEGDRDDPCAGDILVRLI